jgi:glutathione reductase (NADPH)
MTAFDYDLFVIGGGSGGVRAARVAAGHGAKVAIAEEYRFGGTCVIRGCVPKKLLVYASRFRDDFEDAGGFGWTVPKPSFDWATLIAAKDQEIARLEGLYRDNLISKGVATFASRAVLEGPDTLRLADGKRVRARNILVATGGSAQIDTTIDGHEHAITSNEAFHLKELPKRIVIVGGGYIAVEFACIFAGLGSDTTLVYRGDKVLRGFDQDLRDDLMQALEHRGIALIMADRVASIAKSATGLSTRLVSGRTLEADQVMMAIGRAPNTVGLGLEAAGVEAGSRGEIKVDAFSRTNVPGIFAVGDVTDRVNLTPVAICEGHAFSDSVFGGKPVRVDYELIPTAVFTTPEIGTVGLAEHDARAAHGSIDIYKARFRPMKNVLAGRNERMMMKLVIDTVSDKVLGCHVLGPDAAEIVQMAAIALRLGATKADFDATMALHPSVAEELVTMREKWTPAV